jgi:hypothetical protein
LRSELDSTGKVQAFLELYEIHRIPAEVAGKAFDPAGGPVDGARGRTVLVVTSSAGDLDPAAATVGDRNVGVVLDHLGNVEVLVTRG